MHCFIALSLTVASPYLRAFFGEGHGLIIAMSELRCTGNELRITDCSTHKTFILLSMQWNRTDSLGHRMRTHMTTLEV